MPAIQSSVSDDLSGEYKRVVTNTRAPKEHAATIAPANSKYAAPVRMGKSPTQEAGPAKPPCTQKNTPLKRISAARLT